MFGGLLALLLTSLLFSCLGTNDSVAVESVSIDGGNTDATVGTDKTLTATVLPETATNQSVIWESSDETVATINSDGVVTPETVGTTTITVMTTKMTTNGNSTDTITLTVQVNLSTATLSYTGGLEYRLRPDWQFGYSFLD